MIWIEEDDELETGNDDVVDLVFSVQGKTLPVEHEYILQQALSNFLPKICDSDDIGVMLLLAAEEGNGWFRDENPEQVIYLSRRTRLFLRIPAQLKTQAENLSGVLLEIGDHKIKLADYKVRPLSKITTQYARHVVSEHDDEEVFQQYVLDELDRLGIRCKKMLCGKRRDIRLADKTLQTRSLMLADLKPEDALTLQRAGLGRHRSLGCGIFVPHKSLK